MKRLGVIVNPIAGMGGKVGLKGSDGLETLKKAIELGAEPQAPQRAVEALKSLYTYVWQLEVYTYPGDMGENEAINAGYQPTVIGKPVEGLTSAEDTKKAAREMVEKGVDLILFAGGDGTARDIFTAIDSEVPVLGIPAGVKIHSGVYAVNPRAAGLVASQFLKGYADLKEAEVMDIDEDAFRDNRLSAKLYGYMKTPYLAELLQTSKEGGIQQEAIFLEGIASSIIEEMEEGTVYIVGPGTTTKSIFTGLGIKKTLLGVDILRDRKLIGSDVNEHQILEIIRDTKAKIIVSVIGGQGFILGRGNQQISPQVLRKVGEENVILIATPQKMASLRGRPLRVDTGDSSLDGELRGYRKVLTQYQHYTIYKVA